MISGSGECFMVWEPSMTDFNLKDFFESGAFLQTGPDLFKVLIGPFEPVRLAHAGDAGDVTLLYRPNFWDFLNCPSESAQDIVYKASKTYSLHREDFIRFLASAPALEPSLQWEKPSAAEFANQFAWSQQQFSEGFLSKTVPIVRQFANRSLNESNKLWCLRMLLQQNDFGWSYGLFENEKGMIGHTPEMLAKWDLESINLKTMALAGTYPKSATASHAIKTDKKILNEHEIVVNDISQKLQGYNFSKSATDVLELRYLLHLKTEFDVNIKNMTGAMDVIRKLHPTSAMGIFPADHEKFLEFSQLPIQNERGAFAAPFAFFSRTQVNCIVAIRNVQFDGWKTEIFSGCGVTTGSSLEMELEESQLKRNSVKKMLGLKID